jgi:adenylate kinase family enzyme
MPGRTFATHDRQMKRVMIAGGPGSGKSTLAIALGGATGLPVYHMDHIHWQSGWIARDATIKDALTHDIHMRDEWIFEGGHSRTYHERIRRADTFIWLDFPLSVRLWRVLLRSVRYNGKTRPDLPEGCPEQLNWQTFEFLQFIWSTRKTSRAKLAAIYEAPPPHLKTIRLNNAAAVRNFLTDMMR